MAWHIFKKDVRLLWRLAAGVGLIHFLVAVGNFRLGHFGYNAVVGAPLLELFHLLAFLCTGFLIVAVVHQDPLPGVRQDWLTRPIPRGDLLLGKFVFVLLIALCPIFLADLMASLVSGFPPGQSLVATGSRSVYLLLSFAIPIFVLAAVTRSFSEVIIGGLMALVGYVLVQVLYNSVNGMNFHIGSGDAIGWVTESLQVLLFLTVGLAILRLQYWRRKTKVARWIAASVGAACLLAAQLPYQTAFAVEEFASHKQQANNTISIGSGTAVAKFRPATGRSMTGLQIAMRTAGMTSLSLPLHVSGLQAESVLKLDGSDVQLLGFNTDGNLRNGSDLEIRTGRVSDKEVSVWQDVFITTSTYNRIKDQPVKLQIDYSLTLFKLSEAHAVQATNGDQRIAGVGWCATRVNDAQTDIDLSCLQVGGGSPCGSAFLEYLPNRQRNPAISSCHPDYAPFFRGSLLEGSITRFGASLPFRDPSGLTRYPVDSAKLAESQVVLRLYRPVDHFTRQLVIPEIRLRDWPSR